ncbi:MAG TPA: hypothetical protein VL282_05300 [Tepidisphaeraceae bacterium]|nr:hypothetical protein [Tepidisphaeraceae bacterium]
MAKSGPRLILALETGPVQRTFSRLGKACGVVGIATKEAELRAQLSQADVVAAVVTEPMLEAVSGMKVLELARALQPRALRIMVSNFSEIAALIEGVHSGLIQRVLGTPLSEAEVCSVLAASGPASNPLAPRPMVSPGTRAAM